MTALSIIRMLRRKPSSPFTAAQEARIREIVARAQLPMDIDLFAKAAAEAVTASRRISRVVRR